MASARSCSIATAHRLHHRQPPQHRLQRAGPSPGGDADGDGAVGGAEMATTPLGLGGFSAARALSTRNDDPQAASRPWDRDRDGFVLSDGAGVLVLEEYEHAKARGATIYAEMAGFGMSDDAYHMTAPPEDGSGAALSMANAVRDARLDPSSIDYINARLAPFDPRRGSGREPRRPARHGRVGEVGGSEFHQVDDRPPAGGGRCRRGGVLDISRSRDQVAPPTINLDNPQEGCELDYVPHTAREMKIDVALSNSFGFGGTNGTLVFTRV